MGTSCGTVASKTRSDHHILQVEFISGCPYWIITSSLSVCGWFCLFLGIRYPGARLERASSAGGIFADLLLAKAGGGCMALGLSL